MSEQRDNKRPGLSTQNFEPVTNNEKLSPEALIQQFHTATIAEDHRAEDRLRAQLLRYISALERERDEYKQAGLDSIEAQDMWKEAAEAAEASLAQHVAELDKLNAANQAYRGEADSLKASLAQARREGMLEAGASALAIADGWNARINRGDYDGRPSALEAAQIRADEGKDIAAAIRRLQPKAIQNHAGLQPN